MYEINIQTGINYFNAGDKSGALQAFRDVLEKEPNNEIAWMWLAACLNDNNQKRYCFHKILEINPNNSSAQKALAELELQSLAEPRPVPESGTVLKCPSCGSVMGQPDHTGLVQCAYCGTAITYHPPVEKVERKNVERFLELCNTALEGSNYDEAIQYANKILEVDPRNVDAWIKKAIATFWLTTAANNRYDEAMGYLLKAEQIDDTNPQIEEAKESLRTMQSNWFLYLGGQEIDSGNKVYEIYAQQYSVSDAIADGILGSPEAKQQSREYYVKAIAHKLSTLTTCQDRYLESFGYTSPYE